MRDASIERSSAAIARERTLEYIRPGALPSRPAALTLLFILSALYAAGRFAIGVVATGVLVYLVWWENPRVRPPPPAPIPAVSLVPYDGEPIDSEGLRESLRAPIVAHLSARLRLSRDRAEMLDRLLADVGSRLFVANARFEPGLIQEAGQLATGPVAAAPRSNHFFITSRGRTELGDFAATFTPDVGKPVRLVHNVLRSDDDTPRWSALALKDTIHDVDQLTQGALTALQAAALVRELRKEMPPVGQSWEHRPMVQNPVTWQRGTLSYQFANLSGGLYSHRWVLPDGRTTGMDRAPLGLDPLTGVPYPTQSSMSFRYCPGSRAAMFALSGLAFLESILCAYLFVGAIQLLRDPRAGALRHARYLYWQAPVVFLGALATVWWISSLREYPLASSLVAIQRIPILPVITAAVLAYPAAVLIILFSARVSRYLVARRVDAWLDLRRLRARVGLAKQHRPGRLVIRVAVALMVLLSLGHAGSAILCLAAISPARTLAWVHIACAAMVVGMWIWLARIKPVRATATGAALLAALFILPPVARGQPLSQWELHQLLIDARSQDEATAANAVRRLARAGDTGQEPLLQLLEGPEPPIGVDGILSAIGLEWFDGDVRWQPQHWRRALRLTPEWIESIARAPDVQRIAAIEAMGPAPELEPLLRPLLMCDRDDIRRRAAALLLRINDSPIGVVGQLRREMPQAGKSRRQAIITSLTYLRPASDATLVRVLRGEDRELRDLTIFALLQARQPLSAPLLETVIGLDLQQHPEERDAAFTLMVKSREGRDWLIQLALRGSHPARDALTEFWPQTEAVLVRMSKRRGRWDEDRVGVAVERVLRRLNENDGAVESLTDMTRDADEEVAAQACIVLANGEYGARLGPATYRLVMDPEPGPALRTRATTWATRAALPAQVTPLTGPPSWLSVSLVLATLVVPGAMILLLSRQKY